MQVWHALAMALHGDGLMGRLVESIESVVFTWTVFLLLGGLCLLAGALLFSPIWPVGVFGVLLVFPMFVSVSFGLYRDVKAARDAWAYKQQSDAWERQVRGDVRRGHADG